MEAQPMTLVLSPVPYTQVENIFSQLDIASDTRTEYLYRIKLFLEYVQKHGLHRNSFLDFKRVLRDRNDLSVSSKNKYLTSARIYLRELARLGVLPVDLTLNIKGFKQTKRHKKQGLTDEDVEKVLAYIHSLDNTFSAIRFKAIVSLLLLQGWRQIEVVRLNVEDIDFVNNTALVRGKGRDDPELIDLHATTCHILELHLRINNIKAGAVFVSSSNNSQNKRMSTRTIRNLVNDVFRKLDIQKSTHAFRHFFTTKLIETYQSNLLAVARFTRHRSLEMLQVYDDSIKSKRDLVKYYETFNGIRL